MQLFAEAGLTPIDALRAATSTPSKRFGLHDRGIIAILIENMKQRREGFEQLGKLYPKPATVKTERVFINGVNCYWN